MIQHLLNRCEENSTTKLSDEEITEILDDPEMIAFVQMLESYALLREKRAVEMERKRIKEDVMITLSEVLDHSHIFESEYQNLRKKILIILNNGK